MVNQSSLLDSESFFNFILNYTISLIIQVGLFRHVFIASTLKRSLTLLENMGFFSCNLNNKNNRLVWLIIKAWIHKKKLITILFLDYQTSFF
jgi:hypothetical protein